MTKSTDEWERKVRSRPGASDRIDARTAEIEVDIERARRDPEFRRRLEELMEQDREVLDRLADA